MLVVPLQPVDQQWWSEVHFGRTSPRPWPTPMNPTAPSKATCCTGPLRRPDPRTLDERDRRAPRHASLPGRIRAGPGRPARRARHPGRLLRPRGPAPGPARRGPLAAPGRSRRGHAVLRRQECGRGRRLPAVGPRPARRQPVRPHRPSHDLPPAVAAASLPGAAAVAHDGVRRGGRPVVLRVGPVPRGSVDGAARHPRRGRAVLARGHVRRGGRTWTWSCSRCWWRCSPGRRGPRRCSC